jgi:isoleucyl-tRNA synthetase
MISAEIKLVTVSFPLVNDPKTSILAWTTTPWTLPSNLAVCVHPEFSYVKVFDQQRGENFILHENFLTTLFRDPKKTEYKVLGTFKGSDMKGWRYIPLFNYFTDRVRSYSA